MRLSGAGRSAGIRLTFLGAVVSSLAGLPSGGCSGPSAPSGDAVSDGASFLPRPCAPVFDDENVPVFEIEIDPEDWEAIDGETWRPAVFRMGDEVREDARVRARGNNSVCEGLVQLAIAFHLVDPDRRFQGLRRINLDHGGCRPFHERLSTSLMRDLGLPAPCANGALLFVNGERHGRLWTNVEHVDQEMLQRLYGAEDEGNLYKHGTDPRTHEEDGDWTDREAFWDASDVPAVEALVDLDEAIDEWAVEAVLPADGNYWSGGNNFYLYHHPSRGFLFVPYDLDGAPDTAGVDADPVEGARAPHALVVLSDPDWRARYVEAVARAHAAYDPDLLLGRLERWRSRAVDALGDDPEIVGELDATLEPIRTHVPARAEWVRGWLEARGFAP